MRQADEDLMEVMEKNIDNAGLNVDELVSKIGIGRSVFFKKLKSLTGLAPIDFYKRGERSRERRS